MLPIFGPTQFVRATGKPETFTEEFVNCESAAQYKIIVQNGDGAGKNRASSASILLNGFEVIGLSDLNQQVRRVERAVPIRQSNQLQIRLASAPGSLLTVSVECVNGCL